MCHNIIERHEYRDGYETNITLTKDGRVNSAGFNLKKLGNLNDALAALGEFAIGITITKIGSAGAAYKAEGHDGCCWKTKLHCDVINPF